jgi:hypothetical protein
LKKHQSLDVVLLDLSNEEVKEDHQTGELLALLRVPNEKISRKKRPTVFIKGDCRIS